jgi:hypothetical protein
LLDVQLDRLQRTYRLHRELLFADRHRTWLPRA